MSATTANTAAMESIIHFALQTMKSKHEGFLQGLVLTTTSPSPSQSGSGSPLDGAYKDRQNKGLEMKNNRSNSS